MKRVLIFLIVLAAAGLILAGCDSVTTTTLTDPTIRTESRGNNDQATFACFPVTCSYSHGTGPLAAPAGSFVVGYDYVFDNGNPPCNCWWWVDHIYRGHVRFDWWPPRGTRVVSAKLFFTETVLESSSGASTCIGEVRAPNTTWTWDEPYSDSWTPPGPLDVTDLVRQWAVNPSSNHGLYFVGTDESMPDDTSRSCVSAVSNVRVDVVVATGGKP